MREIKFRAWDGVHMYLSPSEIQHLGSWFDAHWPGAVMMNVPKIMQFTGLKDKNGVEIYEGDLLQDSIGICKVVFGSFSTLTDGWGIEEASPKFCCEWLDKSGYCSLSGTGNVSVIGNIYQNPEPLKP